MIWYVFFDKFIDYQYWFNKVKLEDKIDTLIHFNQVRSSVSVSFDLASIIHFLLRQIRPSQIACNVTCTQTALDMHKNSCTFLTENTVENYLSPAHTHHNALKKIRTTQ